MNIRKGTVTDIPEILTVTKACARHMISKGIYQWNEHYPSYEAFEYDVKNDQLYVLVDQEEVIGSIVVSDEMDEEYKTIEWLTPNKKNIYIHRLAVHPEKQGLGYAQRLMDFAENYAKENDYQSVRLDTFSQNSRNNTFYTKRGYQQLGNVYFPKQSTHPFHCYELVLL